MPRAQLTSSGLTSFSPQHRVSSPVLWSGPAPGLPAGTSQGTMGQNGGRECATLKNHIGLCVAAGGHAWTRLLMQISSLEIRGEIEVMLCSVINEVKA